MDVYLQQHHTDSAEPDMVVFSGEKEACRNFIGNYAFEHNYGIYRAWKLDGKYFFDCGPATFYTLVYIELPSRRTLDPESSFK